MNAVVEKTRTSPNAVQLFFFSSDDRGNGARRPTDTAPQAPFFTASLQSPVSTLPLFFCCFTLQRSG
jgi:hypothetical protein